MTQHNVFSIMTKQYNNKNVTQHKDIQCWIPLYSIKPLMLSVIMLNVITLNDIILDVIMLNIIRVAATQAHLPWFSGLLVELSCLLCFVKVPATRTLVQLDCLWMRTFLPVNRLVVSINLWLILVSKIWLLLNLVQLHIKILKF